MNQNFDELYSKIKSINLIELDKLNDKSLNKIYEYLQIIREIYSYAINIENIKQKNCILSELNVLVKLLLSKVDNHFSSFDIDLDECDNVEEQIKNIFFEQRQIRIKFLKNIISIIICTLIVSIIFGPLIEVFVVSSLFLVGNCMKIKKFMTKSNIIKLRKLHTLFAFAKDTKSLVGSELELSAKEYKKKKYPYPYNYTGKIINKEWIMVARTNRKNKALKRRQSIAKREK